MLEHQAFVLCCFSVSDSIAGVVRCQTEHVLCSAHLTEPLPLFLSSQHALGRWKAAVFPG